MHLSLKLEAGVVFPFAVLPVEHTPVLWLHCRSAGAKAPRALCATFPGWQLLP